MKNLKNQNGITLIALVITIIILLILAGVTIAMITGESGILKYSKVAEEKYTEESAREKLEIKLADMHIEKLTNSEYNQDDYLTQQLSNEGFGVSGDIVIVDGWQFQIDRSVPKIEVALGRGIRNEQIQIELSQEVSTDYTKSTITIKVTPIEEIKSILLNGEEVIELIQEDGTIKKEITENIICTVIAKNINDNYNMNSIAVTEITEDMDIWNKEDLVAFSSKVNEGRTFEGKTVRVMDNIDFQGSEEDQYITAGNTEKQFKGNLEGNNKTISNLYINSTSDYQGLIGYASGSKISNLTIENPKITGNNYVGGISGYLIDGDIKGCVTIGDLGKISGAKCIGGISGCIENSNISQCGNEGEIIGTGVAVGGIIGNSKISNIISIYNKGNIKADRNVGGIVGNTEQVNGNEDGNTILYSYNTGDITGSYFVGGIVGIGTNYVKVQNSYNLGNIKGTGYDSTNNNSYVGGIVGYNRGYCKTEYCYNLGKVVNTGAGLRTGGIVGLNNSTTNGSNQLSAAASTIQYNYNSGNIISNGNQIGGICGNNYQYCYTKNNYISSTLKVTKGTETSTTATASANVGTSSNYLGKIVGYAYSTSATYISGNGILEKMPTVYHVVNGLSDEDSEYWSKSNLNAPKLLWEEQ